MATSPGRCPAAPFDPSNENRQRKKTQAGGNLPSEQTRHEKEERKREQVDECDEDGEPNPPGRMPWDALILDRWRLLWRSRTCGGTSPHSHEKPTPCEAKASVARPPNRDIGDGADPCLWLMRRGLGLDAHCGSRHPRSRRAAAHPRVLRARCCSWCWTWRVPSIRGAANPWLSACVVADAFDAVNRLRNLEDAGDPQVAYTLPLTITALRTGGRRVPRRPP